MAAIAPLWVIEKMQGMIECVIYSSSQVMVSAFGSLLEKAQQGDYSARDAIYKLAFFRLKRIASALLQRERRGHTLQPTALVSELFLKLQRLEIRILNDEHFFWISTRAMRQVLIDHSRTRKPVISVSPERIPELLGTPEDSFCPESRLAVKLIFEKLREMDAITAQTVWLRAVQGMTIDELCRSQNRQAWQVRADYDFGLQWMANRLKK